MGPIWDPSEQPAYGLTHMGPMPNPVALPIWVPYGQPIWDPYRHVCWVVAHQTCLENCLIYFSFNR